MYVRFQKRGAFELLLPKLREARVARRLHQPTVQVTGTERAQVVKARMARVVPTTRIIVSSLSAESVWKKLELQVETILVGS